MSASNFIYSSTKALICVSFLSLSVFGLTGCSSLMETPNQKIELIALGTQNAQCDLHIGNATYQTEPPQIVTVRKTRHPIKAVCLAPGNREVTVIVEPELSKYAKGNIVTLGAGAAYDYASGAMYFYPDQIIVDFRQTIATPNMLPAYHASDSQLDGYEHVIEPMGAKVLETRTSVERKNRSKWVDERDTRKATTSYGPKEYIPSPVPERETPYFPEPTFPGTTSF